MKRTLSLIALAAMAASAGPVKAGIEAGFGYDILSVGSDTKSDAQASFGFAVGPTVAYSVTPQIAVGGGVSFQWDDYSAKSKSGSGYESDIKPLTLGLQLTPIYNITDKISVKLGYEWDLPLGGSFKSSAPGSTEADIVWAPSKEDKIKDKEVAILSTHNIVVGGAFEVAPQINVNLQVKVGLTGFKPEYDETNGDLKGAYSSSKNISSTQIKLGAGYSF